MTGQGTRFDKLSPRMRQCLRLVYERKSSKEAAAILTTPSSPLSEATVAKYIALAVGLLGARDRRDAAEQLHAYENPTPYNMEGQSLGVEVGGLPDPVEQRHGPPWWRIPPPFRLSGNTGNDLTVAQRLFWIVAIPVLLSVAFGLLTLALHTIGEVITSI